jgi:ureidoglycolate dehydrogenase (NAD+)
MGRVQQFAREGKQLPPGAAVDADGHPTQDPNKVAALLPFGAHKGYGLMLIDELYAAYGGGSLPRLRGRPSEGDAKEKHSANFFFQCIKPEALASSDYALGRDQQANVKAVLDDILCAGNEQCLLPGQIEAQGAAASETNHGLLFTQAEIDEFAKVAEEAGVALDVGALHTISD